MCETKRFTGWPAALKRRPQRLGSHVDGRHHHHADQHHRQPDKRRPERVARRLAGALGEPLGMILVVPGEPVMHRPPQAAEQEPGPDSKLRYDDEHLPGHGGILARDEARRERRLISPLAGVSSRFAEREFVMPVA